MRLLLFLLAPLFAQSQPDTAIAYKQKIVQNISINADGSVLWKADTIKYDLLFDIKYTPTKIAIDGYGIYKVTKHEIHGADTDWAGYHYYELSNGSKLTWIENAVIWDFPIVNKKTKTIVFQIQ